MTTRARCTGYICPVHGHQAKPCCTSSDALWMSPSTKGQAMTQPQLVRYEQFKQAVHGARGDQVRKVLANHLLDVPFYHGTPVYRMALAYAREEFGEGLDLEAIERDVRPLRRQSPAFTTGDGHGQDKANRPQSARA